MAQTLATHAVDPDAVLVMAVTKLADFWSISNARLGRILGISEASASRLRHGQYRLARNSKPYELALQLVRVFRGLDAILGGDDISAKSWLDSENLALHARPIALMETIPGLIMVANYVDARRARV